MAAYVPLWTKSNFSFLEGSSHPGELVDQAHGYGLPALALTDRDGVYGIVRAHVRAKEVGLRMIYGAQLTVGASLEDSRHVIALASNRAGYGQLTRVLSVGRARCEKGSYLWSWQRAQPRVRPSQTVEVVSTRSATYSTAYSSGMMPPSALPR